jgi:hypothetical protein
MTRFLIALTLLLATAYAQASADHSAWARAAIARLPVYKEDVAADGKAEQLAAIADHVADVSLNAPTPPRQWTALMLSVGLHESGFSLRVGRGDLKRHEGDPAVIDGVRIARARGYFQNHRNLHNAADWDKANGDTAAQVRMGSDGLRRAHFTCARFGVPFPQSALRAYAGSSCSKPMKGEAERVEVYERLLKVVVPAVGVGS